MRFTTLLLLPGLFGCPSTPATPVESDTDTDTDSDTDTDADSDTDTDTDTDADSDTDADADVVATSGITCPPEELLGIVSLQGGFVRLDLFDAPARWVGPPTLVDGACAYHAFDSSACAALTCGPGTTCGYDPVLDAAGCIPEPARYGSLSLVLTDGTTRQTVTPNANGFVSTALDAGLTDQAVSFELLFDGVRVTTGQQLPPGDVAPATHALTSGDECAPGDMALTWTDPGAGAFVMSHTSNNHHLPRDRFTQCLWSASLEAATIGSAQLAPLSGSTCLEFQALQHLFVAAADVPDGCVEFRWEGPSTF